MARHCRLSSPTSCLTKDVRILLVLRRLHDPCLCCASEQLYLYIGKARYGLLLPKGTLWRERGRGKIMLDERRIWWMDPTRSYDVGYYEQTLRGTEMDNHLFIGEFAVWVPRALTRRGGTGRPCPRGHHGTCACRQPRQAPFGPCAEKRAKRRIPKTECLSVFTERP